MGRILFVMLAGVVSLSNGLNLYYANLHSHTSYSDGQSVPSHAFAYARDTAQIDILAVTDHGELMLPGQWADVKAQARAATVPGSFLGIAGFEWSNPLSGHLNILFTDDYTNCFLRWTMNSIYEWIDARAGAIGEFNHPLLGNYNSFAHSPVGDRGIALFEVQDLTHVANYQVMLDSGWRVGCVANQDNHEMDWGRGNRLTGIWADSLSGGAVSTALKQMRTFATFDRNFRLEFTANDSWMGATVNNGRIVFHTIALDPDENERIRRIELVSNGGLIVDSFFPANANTADWRETVYTITGEKRFFYARVIERDGDQVISSPIWTDDLTGITAPAEEGNARRLKFAPNPFPSRVLISLPEPCARMEIADIAGRRIRQFVSVSSAVWDGRDDSGKVVPDGIYIVRVAGSRFRSQARLIKLSD